MKVLFYAAKIYDKKSFDPALKNYPEIEIIRQKGQEDETCFDEKNIKKT